MPGIVIEMNGLAEVSKYHLFWVIQFLDNSLEPKCFTLQQYVAWAKLAGCQNVWLTQIFYYFLQSTWIRYFHWKLL